MQDRRSQRIILTPDNKTAYLLDPVARTTTNPGPRGLAELLVGSGGFSQFVLPLSMSRSVGFFAIPDVPPDATNAGGGESLGERTIAGVPATGTRFVTRLPAGLIGSGRAERWVSPDLKLMMYSRIEDPALGIVEFQVTGSTALSRGQSYPRCLKTTSRLIPASFRHREPIYAG